MEVVVDDDDEADHENDELVSILSHEPPLVSPRRFDVAEKMFASTPVLAQFK